MSLPLRWMLALALLCACTDTSLKGKPQPEVCDGRDNDLDGQTDEGFHDGDGDGQADCEDAVCDLDLTPLQGVASTCILPRDRTDPWQAEVQWTWHGPVIEGSHLTWGGSYPSLYPRAQGVGLAHRLFRDPDLSVGPGPEHAFVLLDTIGLPTPETTVFPYYTPQQPGFDPYYGVVDADGDGLLEMATLRLDGNNHPFIGLLRETGEELWQYPYPAEYYLPGGVSDTQPTFADLLGDGTVDLILGPLVLDAATGTEQGYVPIPADVPQWPIAATSWSPLVADIDLDGRQEVCTGYGCWDPLTGETWWIEIDGQHQQAWEFAALDVDGDPEAEVLSFKSIPDPGGGDQDVVQIREHDGALLQEWRIPNDGQCIGLGAIAGRCAGDLDGDGDAEIVESDCVEVRAYESDGTEMWRVPDLAALNCAVFDLDGDGAMEVIFNSRIWTIPQNRGIYILDGATGTERVHLPIPGYGTWGEVVVGDVDGDGSAEIVTTSGGYEDAPYEDHNAFWVIGNPSKAWQDAKALFPFANYNATNINDDLTVPTDPEPNWWFNNWYHSQVPLGFPDVPGARLRLVILDACTDCAKGSVDLAVGVANDGDPQAPPLPAGTPIEIASDPEDEVLTTLELPGDLASGQAVTLTTQLPLDGISPTGITARIVADGRAQQCDSSQNQDTWTEGLSCS